MDFYQYFKSHKGQMVHLLKNIVEQESPSTNKDAVDSCSSSLLKEFKKIGSKITRYPQRDIGDLYLVEFPGYKEDEGQILILTHIDTVWPVGKIQKMPFYISGDKVFGPGVLDMKASLIMIIFSLKVLKDLNIKPKKKIAVFINSAEEIGSKASYDIIRKLANKSTYVLCLEPSLPGGALKIQRKGRLVVRLETFGKAAHAGTPEEGVNAIEELMLQLRRIGQIKTKETTCNIGIIQGGEKSNIVADKAWALLDIRFWKNEQKNKIIAFLKQLNPVFKGARIKILTQSYTPPMEKTKASIRLLARVRRIASSMDIKLDAGKTGGGSDASIASSIGVPTLDGLGPDGKGIHAEHEHLMLSSLIQRTALLTEMIIHL